MTASAAAGASGFKDSGSGMGAGSWAAGAGRVNPRATAPRAAGQGFRFGRFLSHRRKRAAANL